MALGDTAKLIASLELQDKFSRPAAGITRSLGGLEKGFGNIGRGAGQVAGGIDRLATRAALAAAGGLTAVVKTAVDFETAFTGVEKTVDATVPELAKLEGEFRKLARTIPLSFEELAGIGEQAGALGIATENILAFTKVAAEIGITTNVSSEQAATSLGVLSNVLKLTAEDYDNFGATLVDLGNKGASTEADILAIAERAGAGAALIDIAADATLGWASAIANLGIAPEAGGTSLQTFFTKSLRLVSEGKEELEVFAETAGVSKKAFATMFDQDASGALEQFVIGLGKLDKSARLSVLAALGFKDVRISRAILGLAGDTKNLTDSLNTGEAAWEANTALTVEAEKRYATVASQMLIVKNNVRDAANTIGIELLPIVGELSKEFATFLQTSGTQAGIKTFAKDLAEGIRGLVTELKGTDFSGIIDGMKLAASVAKGAFDAFRSLPGPIQQLAIAALVANKVSGGAIGQIAGGLGSILKGTIQLAFPKLDIFSRGSPVNPMFVSVVGGGLGGVPGKLPFGLPAGITLASLVPLIAGIATPFVMFTLIPRLFPGAAPKPGSFESNTNTGFTVPGRERPDGTTSDPIHVGLPATTTAAMTGIMPSFSRFAAQAGTAADVVKTAINEEGLRASTAENAQLDEAKRHRLATIHLGTQFGSLEQRLIKDKNFKPQIGPGEFIRLLRKTSEFGRRGEGTTIEQGPTTGRDRFGDAFVALVKRVKNPLTPDVFREISNHIIALEEVQSSFIKDGNIKAANHAQRNINELHRVIGSQDQTKTEIRRARIDANQRTAANTAKLESVNTNLTRQRGIQQDALGVSRSILAKPSSLTANVNVTTNVSVNNVLRTITSAYIAAGKGAAGLNM